MRRLHFEIAFLIIAAIMLAVGGFGSRLFSTPYSNTFIDFVIKEGMLPLILAAVFAYILLVKQRPQKLNEYRYLYSLPISSGRLADTFLIQELVRFSWLPAVPVLLMWTLTAFAPVSHICRLSILTLLLYCSVFSIAILLSFILPVKRNNVLVKFNPLLVFLFVAAFVIGTIIFAALDELVSGIRFWIFLLTLFAIIVLIRVLYHKAFTIWMKNNNLFYAPAFAQQNRKDDFSPRFHFARNSQPLLVKNVLKFTRENSRYLLILTAIYILAGYFASRNNARIEDFSAILLTASIIYAIFFSLKSQNFFSEEIESTKLIYSLPVKRRDLYLSIAVPISFWMLIITTIFTLLAVVTRIGAVEGLFYWIKASGLSLLFVTASLNFSFRSYPNEKKAQTNFLYWGLTLIVLIALFYGMRYWVILAMCAVSFYNVWNVKFFHR